jgi:cytochrome b
MQPISGSRAAATADPGGPAPDARVRVWDLPTRLFHWALAVLVVTSFVTGKTGGNAIAWHMWSGYAILALVLFRILWGLAGDRYARFASFPPSLPATWRYLRAGGRSAGHSPLGAWSVYALLAVLLVQATTGLFANDAIFTEGPLAKMVSGATSDALTRIHRLNEWVIVTLVALHLAAVAYYWLVRRDNLLWPMIVGDKRALAAAPARDDRTMRVRALILLACAAGLVTYVVRL